MTAAARFCFVVFLATVPPVFLVALWTFDGTGPVILNALPVKVPTVGVLDTIALHLCPLTSSSTLYAALESVTEGRCVVPPGMS